MLYSKSSKNQFEYAEMENNIWKLQLRWRLSWISCLWHFQDFFVWIVINIMSSFSHSHAIPNPCNILLSDIKKIFIYIYIYEKVSFLFFRSFKQVIGTLWLSFYEQKHKYSSKYLFASEVTMNFVWKRTTEVLYHFCKYQNSGLEQHKCEKIMTEF